MKKVKTHPIPIIMQQRLLHQRDSDYIQCSLYIAYTSPFEIMSAFCLPFLSKQWTMCLFHFRLKLMTSNL